MVQSLGTTPPTISRMYDHWLSKGTRTKTVFVGGISVLIRWSVQITVRWCMSHHYRDSESDTDRRTFAQSLRATTDYIKHRQLPHPAGRTAFVCFRALDALTWNKLGIWEGAAAALTIVIETIDLRVLMKVQRKSRQSMSHQICITPRNTFHKPSGKLEKGTCERRPTITGPGLNVRNHHFLDISFETRKAKFNSFVIS